MPEVFLSCIKNLAENAEDDDDNDDEEEEEEEEEEELILSGQSGPADIVPQQVCFFVC